MFSFAQNLGVCRDRHSGISEREPSAIYPVPCDRAVVSLPWSQGESHSFSELAAKSHRTSGPGRVSVNMNGNVMNTQFALREGIAHQMPVDILLDLPRNRAHDPTGG